MDLEDATSDDDLLLSSEEMSEGEPEEGTPCSASESDVVSSAPSRWSRAASWRFWLSKLPCISLTSAHGVIYDEIGMRKRPQMWRRVSVRALITIYSS